MTFQEEKVLTLTESQAKEVFPDTRIYDGMKITSGPGPIFLVMWGMKCWIPDWETFGQVFPQRHYTVRPDLIELLPNGPTISRGARIIQSDEGGPHYFLTFGEKLPILAPEVIRKFRFNESPLRLPQIVIDSIRNGPQVE